MIVLILTFNFIVLRIILYILLYSLVFVFFSLYAHPSPHNVIAFVDKSFTKSFSFTGRRRITDLDDTDT